ncbi:cytochrome c3 family protein [Aromatoleum petrolei]|uniref:Doubled CXXCH motif domain-containing protein n=1 Tax=Aromatoleum petrolei TaxID=76116 RepID=A0ABX1MUY5_9RHOO|nr:cytochrome c3 family protein [Aromatoleum petrolei]NMF90496.1 hypothetical protein [Aromatoleum petrolei]QTQ35193.1 Doubled CXXCH domain-containing protein [Aromatoleum petrolei]
MKCKISAAFILGLATLATGSALAGLDRPTKFSNQGTIGNTRHNLTQRPTDGSALNAGMMDAYRNDYQQVCVYCHTPHAANTNISAPLWNRTVRTTTYTLYNQQTLSQDATQPGPNSLTCLSCHDGQTAVDSIVNMPGSGGYNGALALDPSAATAETLLDTWRRNGGDPDAVTHQGLNSDPNSETSCLSCHSPGKTAAATNFQVFAIGTDLTNDHPVGVKLPAGSDWNVPTGTYQNIRFFDKDGDNRPDKDELRFYDSGNGYEVECASCHDPHGVPGTTSTFLPTFLRVTADGSQICMTCHVK